MKIEFYITSIAQQEMPCEIIEIMMFLIMEISNKDYLQVIMIEEDGVGGKITIRQEIPKYEKSIIISWKPKNSYKLFYIDQVLMLAEEY